MNEFAIAIMYVATLAFVGWGIWLWLQYRDLDKRIKEEILKLRADVNSLQLAQAMKPRAQGIPFGPPSS